MEIEKVLDDKDLIVSSTDKKGIITYVNSTFSKISEYTKDELYGQPHNIIRHPDMPKTIFKYAWENLLAHKPVVAYVKNYVKGNEKFYWVKAVMYPKIVNDDIETITSYRTKATDFEIEQIGSIYQKLIVYEKTHNVDEAYNYFLEYLNHKNLTYDKMINRLIDNQQILNIPLLQLDITKFRTDHMIFRSRIESLVEKGYEDVEVTTADCCEFGERLKSLENESFANDPKYLEIKKIHENLHTELQEYVDANEDKKQSHMKDVYRDIDALFKLTKELKDDHKHDQL